MSALPVLTDPALADDVIAHLDLQLVSARRVLQIVLAQGAAIRRRDVHTVVQLAGMLQAELQKREFLEAERSSLLDRAGGRLGVPGSAVTLTMLSALMDPVAALQASQRSLELRGMLDEIQREHTVNRALMTQELAFLDHLLRLADDTPQGAYDAAGDRPTLTPTLVSDHQPVLDLQA